MACRVVANSFIHAGRDVSDALERQALAALAATLGPRAFGKLWELSIGTDQATGAITFAIHGPDL